MGPAHHLGRGPWACAGGDTRRVAVAELLPPVLLASIGGAGPGMVLARAIVGLLDLRLLTRQAVDPLLPSCRWWQPWRYWNRGLGKSAAC